MQPVRTYSILVFLMIAGIRRALLRVQYWRGFFWIKKKKMKATCTEINGLYNTHLFTEHSVTEKCKRYTVLVVQVLYYGMEKEKWGKPQWVQ